MKTRNPQMEFEFMEDQDNGVPTPEVAKTSLTEEMRRAMAPSTEQSSFSPTTLEERVEVLENSIVEYFEGAMTHRSHVDEAFQQVMEILRDRDNEIAKLKKDVATMMTFFKTSGHLHDMIGRQLGD